MYIYIYIYIFYYCNTYYLCNKVKSAHISINAYINTCNIHLCRIELN